MENLTKILIVCMFFAVNTCKAASSTEPTELAFYKGLSMFARSFRKHFGEEPDVTTRTEREKAACRVAAWRSNDLAHAAELRQRGLNHKYHAKYAPKFTEEEKKAQLALAEDYFAQAQELENRWNTSIRQEILNSKRHQDDIKSGFGKGAPHVRFAKVINSISTRGIIQRDQASADAIENTVAAFTLERMNTIRMRKAIQALQIHNRNMRLAAARDQARMDEVD